MDLQGKSKSTAPYVANMEIRHEHDQTCIGQYDTLRYQSSHELCRDRWIVWRIKDDTVELSELSLHLNLSGNGLRLYFPNTTVLSPVSKLLEQ